MISFEQFTKIVKLYIPENFKFKCLDCGDCCRHESGYIFLMPDEINIISNFLKMDPDNFLNIFAFNFSKSVYSLKEKENYDCVFWDEENRNGKGGCSLYKIRPMQCKNFPFWISTFSDKDSFELQKKRCKGIMSQEGKQYRKIEIYKLVYRDLKKRMIQYQSFLSDDIQDILFYNK